MKQKSPKRLPRTLQKLSQPAFSPQRSQTPLPVRATCKSTTQANERVHHDLRRRRWLLRRCGDSGGGEIHVKPAAFIVRRPMVQTLTFDWEVRQARRRRWPTGHWFHSLRPTLPISNIGTPPVSMCPRHVLMVGAQNHKVAAAFADDIYVQLGPTQHDATYCSHQSAQLRETKWRWPHHCS